MKCPHCESMGPAKVIESRATDRGVRRRRLICFACKEKFTNYTGIDRKSCSIPDGNHRVGKAIALLKAGMS